VQVTWDYTELARAYVARPDYSPDVVHAFLAIAAVEEGNSVCDVGAGVGHLAKKLGTGGLRVVAVEPNDAMRSIGQQQTMDAPNIKWVVGTGEETGQETGEFRLVTFGSSFNVCDQASALRETHRILEEGGHFVCIWNHRDLSDPLQSEIEALIKRQVPAYEYGNRRADQSTAIRHSSLFAEPIYLEARIVHRMARSDVLEAWRSHATLQRQAGPSFPSIVESIADLLSSTDSDEVEIPYRTIGWIARRL